MILVTGGTGLIGSHLLFHLLKKKQQIKALYRNEKSLEKTRNLFSLYVQHPNEMMSKIEWIKADITDISNLNSAFKDVRQVYHAAALVSFNPGKKRQMQTTNVEGTANMVHLSIENKIKKILYVSSIATLGDSDFPITERTPWTWKKSGSEYGKTKYLSEMEVWRGSQEGLNVIIVNPSVVIGAGFWHTGFGKIFEMVANGMKFYTEGITGFIDVWDVVKIMNILMENKDISNQSFIISAENLSYKQMFSQIAIAFGKNVPKHKLHPWMLSAIWRFEYLKNILFQSEPILTRSTANTAFEKHFYSSEKIMSGLKIHFTPITTSISNIVEKYKQDRLQIYQQVDL